MLFANNGLASMTLDGAGGNDTIYGSNFDDLMIGGAGNDFFWGFLGGDAMQGGADNDVYIVEQAGDIVTEAAGQGTDTVYAAIDYLSLPDNVENLFIYGAATIGTGNSADNAVIGAYLTSVVTLYGGGGNDFLLGGAGGDYLSGGIGTDTLVGGAGNDIFVYYALGLGIDTITDFAGGAGVGDVINVNTVFANFATVQAAATQMGADTVITVDASNKIVLQSFTVGNLVADDFLF